MSQLGASLIPDLPDTLKFSQLEEDILGYWTSINAFQTSIQKSVGRPRYTFYDGPPFATGLPHYGHILAGTIKDVVCRYAHQTGHHVERRFGWDCHGLPIEFEIEKQLGIKSSDEVRALGIDKYNEACRSIVMRYAAEWETIITRLGRWIDFKNDYKTMNVTFMESVWWVFKELWEKKLVYRGFKVMPFSTSCTTPLSNFEANMNYKDVSDPSALVSFPLVEDETGNTSFVAWTTTPWTLPSNLALCVNPTFDYVTVEDTATKKRYIVAEMRTAELYTGLKKTEADFVVVSKCKGIALEGKSYVPLFDYFKADWTKRGAFRVVSDGFVTSDSGTGIVHCAPGFGEEDFRVCRKFNIIEKEEIVCPVDENGKFTAEITDMVGVYCKEADNTILAKLKERGRLVNKASIVHSYPFCWRSDTPLIYKAVSSWFVNVELIKDKLLTNSQQSYWVPEFVQTKRFNNWLEDAKDWAVSRSRYWGTPLPIWRSDDWEEIICIGSVAELERLTGATGITDIHMHRIDHLTIPSSRPGKPPLRRVAEVFDCWFESGAMPYGQMHYPFENKELFEQSFPANFIAEGLDQTRGWFYTLMVLSTALFDKPPFKNLIVNGLVLAEDGKKMSKRLKNYPDPMHVVNTHGADALRLYLINSPVVRAEPLRFKEAGVQNVVREVFLPLVNALKFFVQNANRFVTEVPTVAWESHRSANTMDRWILSATQSWVSFVHNEMKLYRLYTVVPAVVSFLDNLTNWYVRMNRRRMKGGLGLEDRRDSLCTLFQVLYVACRMMAPFCPFVAELVYMRLKVLLPAEVREDSIHYVMVPSPDESLVVPEIERAMSRMQEVIEMVRVLRDRVTVPLKTPVREVIVCHPDAAYIADIVGLKDYVAEEVNAFEVRTTASEEMCTASLEANLPVLGKRLKKEAQNVAKLMKSLSPEEVQRFISTNKVVVGGQELTGDEVKIVRSMKAEMANYQSNSEGAWVVFLDTRQDAETLGVGKAREFVSRTQQLRKKAGLVLEDVIEIYYQTEDKETNVALRDFASVVDKTIKVRWGPVEQMPAGAKVIISEVVEIGDTTIRVTLTSPTK
jgi:isoleucyl-tRNA synthetase